MPKFITTPDGLFIERVCKYCGVVTNSLSEKRGPHGFGLRCTGCERHNGWLSYKDTSEIELMQKVSGNGT